MNLKALLAASLGLNLILAVYSATRKAPPVPVAAPVAALTAKPAMDARPSMHLPVAGQSFDWRQVESGDYRQYIENLRSIGCPEETIRDIIVADVNKLFDARRHALVKPEDQFKFWEASQSLFSGNTPEKLDVALQQRKQLAQEKRALLKELLGVDIPQTVEGMVGAANPVERMLGFLSPDKRLQLLDLEQRYSAKRMKGMQPGANPDEAVDPRKLDAEKAAEMAKVLTPQELEEYQLRMSPTATQMRSQLASFKPTEQEFREIFKLKQKFDQEFGSQGFVVGNQEDPALSEKKQGAQELLAEQIRATLGDERYEQYQREQDWSYRAAVAVVEQTGAPKGAALKVHQLKQLAEEQARAFRSDQNMSVEEQEAALLDMRQQTESAVAELLGEKGYEAYVRQPGATWLRTLHPGRAR